MTIRFNDNLMAWLKEQARLNHRSVNRELEHLVERAMRDSSINRLEAGSSLMCHTGLHRFKNDNPAMSDYCNCGMFIYGEVAR